MALTTKERMEMLKIAPKLTYKQAVFAKEYMENGFNGTKAALVAYNTKSRVVASTIAVDNIRKPSVRELLERYSNGAVRRVNRLSRDAKSEYVQLQASNSILDRAGYAAPSNTVDNRQLTINISGESASRYQLVATQSHIPATDEESSVGQSILSDPSTDAMHDVVVHDTERVEQPLTNSLSRGDIERGDFDTPEEIQVVPPTPDTQKAPDYETLTGNSLE